MQYTKNMIQIPVKYLLEEFMLAYKAVYEGGTDEIVEKKSRFIAQVFSVETEEEAAKIIEENKKKYWDARHNCYAFVLGSKGEVSRCSDDGEPSGTAGRPILEVILGREIRNVLVIVTRYFGGTLLGTGGLVRAYSQATQAGLDASVIITKEVGHKITITTDYNGVGKLQYLANQLELSILSTDYSDVVTMTLLIPVDFCEKVEKEVTEATAGQAKIEKDETAVYFAEIGKQIEIFQQ